MITKAEKQMVLDYIEHGITTAPRMASLKYGSRPRQAYPSKRERQVDRFRTILLKLEQDGLIERIDTERRHGAPIHWRLVS